MKHLEDLKEVVKRELEKFAKQGDISVSNLEKICDVIPEALKVISDFFKKD